MPIIYIGSDPTWGPQQQVARRHLQEQTSVTLGTADYDPTVKPSTGGQPWQQRSLRDPAYAAVGANLAWRRLRLNTNDLGTANADPTVRPNLQNSRPYQFNPPPSAIPAVQGSHFVRRNYQVSGLSTITGTSSTTNNDDTLAASGSTVSGTSSTTNNNDTLAAVGTGGTVTTGGGNREMDRQLRELLIREDEEILLLMN